MTLPGAATSIAVAAAGALALASAPGCSLRAKAIPVVDLRPPRSATFDEVLGAHEQATLAIATLSASGHLQVRDGRGGRQRDFGVRVLCGRGGRLYLKASVAVVTALEATSDGQRFWLQVPSRRKVFTGDARTPPRVEAGAAGHDFDALRPADLAAALVPEPLEPRADETLLFESEREAFSLALGRAENGRGRVRRRVWLARETLLPSRSRTYDEAGEVALEAAFGDWREGLPRRVSVARPAQGYEAVFVFDKAERNVALPERAFRPRLPEGYEVVELER